VSSLDEILSRARLLKSCPDDVVPYGEGILSYDETPGADLEADLWPADDADPVDLCLGTEYEYDDSPLPGTPTGADCCAQWDYEADTAADDLQVLCEAVVTHTTTSLNEFVTETLPAPTGARAVGCILLLADNEDSARFWWQYAAGAGDNTAGYCLYLHHLARGDALIADWWRSQTRITDDTPPYEMSRPTIPALVNAITVDAKISTVLRVLRALTDTSRQWNAMISDVTAYVLSAVSAARRRETSLPVPEGFARDLRAVLADAARYETASVAPGPERVQPPRVLVGQWLDS
jgi:hypothetical protein